MKFSHKIILSILGVLVVGITAVSTDFYITTSRILEQNLKRNATNRAIHITETLDRFMVQRSRDINVVSTSTAFHTDPLDLKEIEARLKSYLKDWDIYSSFSFYDSTGRCVVDTAGSLVGQVEKDRTFFKEALEKGDSIGSDLDMATARKEALVTFSSTVIGRGGTVLGVVAGKIPISLLKEIASEGVPFQLDLIDTNRRIIFSTRAAGTGNLEFNAPFFDDNVLTELHSGKSSGFSSSHWLEGIGTHYTAFATEPGYRKFKGNGWTIVLWVPSTYISAPLNKFKANVATSFITAILLSILISSYLGRQLSKPLKQLADAAKEVGRGNLNVTIDYHRHDEFGELAWLFTTMAENLKAAKYRLENYSGELEKQVHDRTHQLEASVQKAKDLQGITLSILEDTDKAKTELAQSNTLLTMAQFEISEFARNLEEKVNERTRELAVLYDISNAVSTTNDYKTLSQLIMESLAKIVDYDICALLFLDAQSVIFGMKIPYEPAEKFADEVKTTLIESVETLTGESIRTKKLISKLISPIFTEVPKDRSFAKIKSSLDLPIVVSGKTIGAITILSCEDQAFSEEHARLIRTITNHISSALVRLHTTQATEKSKMESMVESMSEGIIMTDEHGAVLVFNPRAKEIVGLSTSDFVPTQNLIDKMQSLGLMDLLQKCQNDNEPITQVITLSSAARDVFIRCNIAPVINPEGVIIGHVTILRDITKEEELDHIKTEFVSTVSHELRTPLSITKEGISLVLDNTVGELNERQKHFLTAAKNNIDRLTNIINDLLDIAKIDAGKITLNAEPTDLSALIRQVVDSFQIRARRKGVALTAKLPALQTIINIDREKMTQTLVNLIDNALKFTNTGYVEVTLEDLGTEVECIVEDTGVGISRDDLKNLFKKFQQFNRVESSEKGTGLGLSIVKGLIDLHRGKIWAESKLGVGTKFHVTLPKQ